MAQLVDHFLTGLTLADGEHCTLRRKQEHRLTQLLAELVDTERKYVDDLETVRVETFAHFLSQSTTGSPTLHLIQYSVVRDRSQTFTEMQPMLSRGN